MVSKILKTEEAIANMSYEGAAEEYYRYGHGHINDTFYVSTMAEDGRHAYILQRMNREVFKDPVSLMKNITGVTSFLRREIEKEGGDPLRETLNLVPAKNGRDYYVDSDGQYWRSYLFIGNATCYDKVVKPEDFYQSAKAFGRFQRQLSQYPADELYETIPNFHNTPVRLATLKKAVEEGCFREDLYYRLAELEIVQPPLKDCKDDILPLAEFFRKEHSGRIRVKNEGFTEEAKACMLGYDWPGNVRELNAKIKRAVIVADNVLLDVCDLGLDNVDCSDNPDIRIIQEKEKIRNLLEKNHGNVSKTAVEFGCSRTALYKKMKKLGLK